MDVRFLRMHRAHGPGAIARNYHPGAAAELIRRGIAEAYSGTPPVKVADPPKPPTKKKR